MAKMHVMQSMELDDEDKLDMVAGYPNVAPDYPCGLRLCLTLAELRKLDVDPSEAVVGGLIHLHAMARITNVHHNENDSRIEAQIEDLAVESEDQENERY